MEKDVFEKMGDRWPSAMVARTEIERFTGGMMSGKYCANLDSLNTGCPNRIKIGRKIGYPVDSLVEWLRGRATS